MATPTTAAAAATKIPAQSEAAEAAATTTTTTGTSLPEPGRPASQLDIEDPVVLAEEDGITYPTGPKLWLTHASICIAVFLHGLDLTIVAVAVPSMTDQFKTVADIGWYSAAYMLSSSSFVFFFGKLYTVSNIKPILIFGLLTFELGSLLCTFAQTSHMFILGRAVAGLGSAAIGSGLLKILRHLYPLRRQAAVMAVTMAFSSVGLVSAPLIGGLLTDAFTWRACFGINIPLGLLCVVLTWFCFEDPVTNEDARLPLVEKVKRVDLLGTLLVVPAATCFLMGLQWGGIRYGWQDVRIIVLFVVFAVTLAAFGYVQYKQGENATIPLRILKKRSILAATWFTACCNGILAVTEYYLAIYFQGVRGLSATKAGLLGLPMIAGLGVATLAAGWGVNKIGYYFPFMFATSVLAPIAAGLLTTLNLDESVVKPTALLGFLGVGVGLGMQAPLLAVQTVLSIKDVSIGGAITSFGGGMGSALWTCASATLFQGRLVSEIENHSPGINGTALEDVGLSELRTVIGSDRLKDVLSGYTEAVVQTLYLPLALALATIIGSVAMERRNMKQRQD